MAVSPGPNISPKTIAEAEFPSAFRGYETEAVRAFLEDVAQSFADLEDYQRSRSGDDTTPAQIRELRKENLRLRSKLKADTSGRPQAVAPTTAVDLSDDQIAAVLGKEATRILEAARAAAADIIDKANEEANDIREVAQGERAKVLEDAEVVAQQRKAEIERNATKTLAVAQKQASEIREAAKADYDSIRKEVSKAMSEAKQVLKTQEAKSQKRAEQMVSDAELYRKQAITELLNQRQTGSQEMTALLETRDLLAEGIAKAQRQIDDLAVDLEEINSRQKVSFLGSNFEDDLKSTLAELDEALPVISEPDNLEPIQDALEGLGIEEIDLSSLDTDVTDQEIDRVHLEVESEKSLEDFIDLDAEVDYDRPEPVLAAVETEPTYSVDEDLAAATSQTTSADYLQSGDLWGDQDDATSEINITFTDEDPTDLEGDIYIEPEASKMVEFPEGDFEWDEIFMTVSGRAYGAKTDETRGDLPSMETMSDPVPEIFKDRDVALSRLGPDLRRKIKRALNDDQSEVLDRLRTGSGSITVDELPSTEDQVVHYYEPLRENLQRVAQAGAEIGDGTPDFAAIEAIALQLARHLVISVRIPIIKWIESYDGTKREASFDPIRAIYRDYRNNSLAALLEDALFEVFAIGLYMAIEPEDHTIWLPDPRLEPDPLCEINARTTGLTMGEIYPSGHSRPLSLPGCRCLLVRAE